MERGDFSHVIADSAPQPGCTRIYSFTRAWKTQQIKLWSCCLLEMDIFILDFGFSSPKSAFEIVSHQTVARVWGYTNLWIHFFWSVWATRCSQFSEYQVSFCLQVFPALNAKIITAKYLFNRMAIKTFKCNLFKTTFSLFWGKFFSTCYLLWYTDVSSFSP